MNRFSKIVFLTVIAIAVVSSCDVENSKIRETLIKAEEVMADNPDSSLAVLRYIKGSDIKGRELKARYALILSMALDKNYIDTENDSLISIAVDYYEDNGTDEEKLLSLYYLGRVQYNGGKYGKSVYSYTKAEQYADTSNPYYAGLLYAQLGYLYSLYYDYPKSLSLFEKSYGYYVKSGKPAHQYYAILDIGQIYLAMKQYDDAEANIKKVMEWAYLEEDRDLCQYCFDIYLSLLQQKNDVRGQELLLDSKYHSLCNDSFATNISMAYLSALKGRKQVSDEYIAKAYAKAEAISDTATILFNNYSIYKEYGDYKKALAFHEKLFHIQDSIVRAALLQPILSSQRDYYQSQAEIASYKLEKNRQKLLLVSLLAILIAGIILMYFRYMIVLKNTKIKQYLDLTLDMQNSLFSKDAEIKEMSEEVDIHKKSVEKMRDDINILFKKQYALLDNLSATYYETHSLRNGAEQRLIYTRVRKEIETLSRDGESTAKLESIVNKYKSNVMLILRKEVPCLSDLDYRLLCFIYAGFSAKSISVFTNDTISNIYTKKSRLKAEITRLNTPNSKILLDMMP